MGSKFYDIPFLSRSSDTDFNCLDGEIFSSSNLLISLGENIISSDGKYEDIASENFEKPPVPDISFGIVRTVLQGWHLNPDQFPSKTISVTDTSIENLTVISSKLLPRFLSDANFQDLFVSPFFAVAAWRKDNGDFISFGEPVLLIPNSKIPLVATDNNSLTQNIDMRIAGAVCELYFKIKPHEELRDWVGRIKSLEILVSEPLHSYSAFNSFIPLHRTTSDSYSLTLDPDSGNTDKNMVCTEILPLAWSGSIKGPNIEDFTTSFSLSLLKFRRFSYIEFKDIDLASEWTSVLYGKGFVKVINGWDNKELILGENISEPVSSKKACPLSVRGTGQDFSLTTRPIKLSGAGSLKKISKVYLRGGFKPENINLYVYASRDMLHWWCIGKRKGGKVVIPAYSTFRFFKIQITGQLSELETLEGMSII